MKLDGTVNTPTADFSIDSSTSKFCVVTSTELGYLSGNTSNIKTQFNKITSAKSLLYSNLDANELPRSMEVKDSHYMNYTQVFYSQTTSKSCPLGLMILLT
jgi:hypothetical protein